MNIEQQSTIIKALKNMGVDSYSNGMWVTIKDGTKYGFSVDNFREAESFIRGLDCLRRINASAVDLARPVWGKS